MKPKKQGKKIAGSAMASKEDSSLEWTKEQQRMKEARQFIETLLTRCGSRISETVQRAKVEEHVDTSTWNELKFYQYPDTAGWSPVFYMIAPNAEESTKKKDGSVVDVCPGLAMILKHKPDVNKEDLNNRTPLVFTIVKEGWSNFTSACAVKMLVENGADMDHRIVIPEEKRKDSANVLRHGCAINMAAGVGNVEATIYLAENGADLHIPTSIGSESVLHKAVEQNRAQCNVLPMVESLVVRGGNVNAVSSLNMTPLHTALIFNSEGSDGTAEIEAYLIDNGANVYGKDIYGRLPLHNVFTKVGKTFIPSKDDPIDQCTTVVAAMRSDKIDEKDNYGATALHYAARKGAGVCCMTLLQKGANIHLKDGDGNTPLALAALHNHESCVILLLQRKADFSETAVSLPAQTYKDRNNKDLKIFKKDYSEVDEEEEELPAMQWFAFRKYTAKKKEPQEFSIFQACVSQEWQGVVFMMLNELDNFKFSPSEAVQAALNVTKYNLALTIIRKIKDKRKFGASLRNGQTLFHVFALKAKPDEQEDLQLRLAEKLYEVGVPLNKKDKYGCHPLHYACLRHNAAFVRFILEKERSTDASEQDNNRRTPLDAVLIGECLSPCSDGIGTRFREVVGELMKNGARIDDHKFAYDPPEFCVFGFRPQLSDKESEDEYVKPARKNEVTSLILSINFENFSLTSYLLENKADINGSDRNGRTAMMYAVFTNDAHFVRLLLDPKYEKKETADEEQNSDEEQEEDEEDDEEEEDEEDDQSDYNPDSDDDDDAFSNKRKRARSSGGRQPRARIQKKLSRRVFAHGTLGEDDADEDVSSAKKRASRKSNKSEDLAFWKKFVLTKKTSKVNLNAADTDGRTVLHHLKGTLRLGSFENVEILKLLVDNGADVNRRDKQNSPPILYYIADAATNLFKAMKTFVSGVHYPALSYDLEETTDEIDWTDPPPDFRADAAALLRKIDERKSDKTKAEDKKLQPDSVLKIKEGHVVEDEEQGIPYDVLLMKIDVAKGRYCLYNFYKLQIVYDEKKKLHVMMNKWGRIGDEGQYQQTPFATLEEVTKEFCKIFRSKTGNKWTDVKSFVIHPKKYRLIPVEDRLRKDKEYSAIDFDLSSKKSSKLPVELEEIMKEMSDVDGLQAAQKHTDINLQNTPVGRISEDYLKKAKDTLSKLEPLIEKWEGMGSPTPEQHDEFHEAADQIAKLTNEYHYLVPSGGFAFEKVAPFLDATDMNAARKRLNNLEELELAGKLLAAAQFRKNDINPMDYMYRSLNCQLKSIDEDARDGLAQYLLRYIHAGQSDGQSNFVVERIFEVARDGELFRYESCKLENQKLLFHGTKSSNLLGILSRGLLVTPIEVPWTGRGYGNGIYFSDSFKKSYDYSCNFNSNSKKRFVFICQVKVGNPKRWGTSTDVDIDEKKFNSLMVVGGSEPNPKYDVTLPSGAVIPLGNPMGKSYYYTDNSEYIISKEEQVCIRYLVQLRDC